MEKIKEAKYAIKDQLEQFCYTMNKKDRLISIGVLFCTPSTGSNGKNKFDVIIVLRDSIVISKRIYECRIPISVVADNLSDLKKLIDIQLQSIENND